MNIFDFIQYAKKHDGRYYKSLIMTGFILLFILIIAVALDHWRVKQVHQNVNDFNTADDLIKTAAEFQNNKVKIEGILNKARIAKKEEIDNIQKNIIEMAAQYEIDIQKISTTQNQEFGTLYEISMVGNWSNTMGYLYYLSNYHILLKLLDANMDVTQEGKISCTSHYKIYME